MPTTQSCQLWRSQFNQITQLYQEYVADLETLMIHGTVDGLPELRRMMTELQARLEQFQQGLDPHDVLLRARLASQLGLWLNGIDTLCDGVARVYLGSLDYRLLQADGSYITDADNQPLRFFLLEPFQNGLAVALLMNGRRVFIRPDGSELELKKAGQLIRHNMNTVQINELRSFRGGYGMISLSWPDQTGGSWFFVRPDGELISRPDGTGWKVVGQFSQGWAFVLSDHGVECIDERGQDAMADPTRLAGLEDLPEPFGHGLSIVTAADEETATLYKKLMHQDGSYLQDPTTHQDFVFTEKAIEPKQFPPDGLLMVRHKTGLQYLRPDGSFLTVPAGFEPASQFVHGVAVIKQQRTLNSFRFRFLNTNGDCMVVPANAINHPFGSPGDPIEVDDAIQPSGGEQFLPDTHCLIAAFQDRNGYYLHPDGSLLTNSNGQLVTSVRTASGFINGFATIRDGDAEEFVINYFGDVVE